MHPLLIVFVLSAGLWLIKVLATEDRVKRGKSLRLFTSVVIVAIAVLLSLRLRQYWVALLSFAWLLIERRVFAALAAGAHGASPGGYGTADAPPASGRRMSRAEALSVLGLEEGASEEAILDAYKNLMKRVHPDKGGSGYLAAKLNQAKDVLTS